MAVREAPKSSTRAKQFAFKYFEQVYKRVKELEHEREAQQPNRQPLIYRGESSGGSHPIQAGETLELVLCGCRRGLVFNPDLDPLFHHFWRRDGESVC